jgi:hypothetical protein
LLYFARMKWKELEDFDWFPPILRRYQMQYIGVIVQKLGFYRQVIPIVNELVELGQITEIIDLCSGSGSPALVVHRGLKSYDTTTYLSDKYPQPFEQIAGVNPQMLTLDILDLKPKPGVLYTMYNAFHHFDADQQADLIRKMITARAFFLAVEVIKPNLWNALLVTLASSLGSWVFFWFIRPFEWRRFVFTYLLPINILTIWIDGMVSIIKSKSAKTYQNQLDFALNVPNSLRVTQINSFPAVLTIIKITPIHA